MPTPHQTGTCSNGALSIAYRHFGAGDGLPVLIVHGLSYFSYDWIDVESAHVHGHDMAP